ncbi:MAG TPA: homoserine kinase [Armatimonadota bacterium]|nr:homoserine kinase [Armatimonadota bacterium]
MPQVTVRVPASTTNLGPGFDALGLALRLHNHARLRVTDGPVRVTVAGEGAGILESGPENLVYRAVERLCREAGMPAPALEIHLENRIPVSRGLGSSSTAIVAGLVGANALLGEPLDREALLRLAVEMEGHPDNVTPALLGGFQVTSLTEEGLLHLRLPTPAGLRAVVCIPSVAVSTAEARRVLPREYSRADAVFNIGRVSLLVAALLTGETAALRAAMQDRIHQPYRAPLVPGFAEAMRAALEAGAAGACLSGSGSTMLALATTNESAIGEAMTRAVRAAGAGARWLALDIDEQGATVETITP